MDAANAVLLILTAENSGNAVKAALEYARSTAQPLHAIQILTSDLYRYGHHDLIATRPSKREFLLHIRNEVLERGKAQSEALQNAAREAGVSLEMKTVESEDIFPACTAEAGKGYARIFLPKQERKLFPLFQKNLATFLKKKTSSEIILC